MFQKSTPKATGHLGAHSGRPFQAHAEEVTPKGRPCEGRLPGKRRSRRPSRRVRFSVSCFSLQRVIRKRSIRGFQPTVRTVGIAAFATDGFRLTKVVIARPHDRHDRSASGSAEFHFQFFRTREPPYPRKHRIMMLDQVAKNPENNRCDQQRNHRRQLNPGSLLWTFKVKNPTVPFHFD